MGLKIRNVTDDLAKHPTKKYGQRDLKDLKYIVVHHSAQSEGNPYAYARYHVQKGWPGIGYHYVIQRDGTIYKVNENKTWSYHCGADNRYSIGICLTGNFNSKEPEANEAQYKSLLELIDALLKAYPGLEVKGHRELRSTKCPGDKFDLGKLRSDAGKK